MINFFFTYEINLKKATIFLSMKVKFVLFCPHFYNEDFSCKAFNNKCLLHYFCDYLTSY